MLSVRYAEAASPGTFASKIGWIDFGTNVQLSNQNKTVVVANQIPGGYIIKFRLSIIVDGNSQVTPQVIYQGRPLPTIPAAPFGNVMYLGIKGNVALYPTADPLLGNVIYSNLTLDQIQLVDENGKNHPFLFFAADAEVTNQETFSEAEEWSITSTPAGLTRVQLIPSVQGDIKFGPLVTQEIVTRVIETGLLAEKIQTASNLFVTESPTQILAKSQVDGSRSGFSFGVIVLDEYGDLLHKVADECVNWINPSSDLSYRIPIPKESSFLEVKYQGESYSIGCTPPILEGTLGTYIFTKNYVILEAKSCIPWYSYDFFEFVISQYGNSISIPYLFGYSPYHCS